MGGSDPGSVAFLWCDPGPGFPPGFFVYKKVLIPEARVEIRDCISIKVYNIKASYLLM